MLLENNNAVMNGGGGYIGGAVARALPAEVGNVAALMASDCAGTMTGTAADISCGQIVDRE